MAIPKTPEQTVDDILALLEQGRHMHYGEDVTQLEHALQCAQLATDAGSDEATIIAALLHDIGHIITPEAVAHMDDFGVVDHETAGANYLRDHGFSEEVAQLVEAHVAAKRYLTFKHPDYYAQLSVASQETLLRQGGPMTAAEAAAFEADPRCAAKLQLRAWDDQGKHTDREMPPAAAYRDMLLRHLGQSG